MNSNEQKSRVIPLTRDDLILERLNELKAGQRELKTDLTNLDRKFDARIDKLEARIDRFETELRSTTRHSQAPVASVIAIALAVIYFVFTH